MSQTTYQGNGKWLDEMFQESIEPKLEAGVLRSGRRFRSGKRRKTEEGRRAPSPFNEIEHELQSQVDEGSCDEEEDYSPILEGEKESKECEETPRSRCNYLTLGVSPEVRSRASSPERVVNTNSASTTTNAQESIPPLDHLLENLDNNAMAGVDIWLPIFNGNGAEDPEQYWFICEAVWMVFLLQNADLKKVQMITTLRGRALDWFMKFLHSTSKNNAEDP